MMYNLLKTFPPVAEKLNDMWFYKFNLEFLYFTWQSCLCVFFGTKYTFLYSIYLGAELLVWRLCIFLAILKLPKYFPKSYHTFFTHFFPHGTWVAGPQMSYIGIGASGTWSCTHVKFWHCRWQHSPLWHNTPLPHACTLSVISFFCFLL